MDVALISDTHIPSRSASIPGPFRDRIRRADHVVHAGDFDASASLADVQDLAADLTAVHGNMDPDLGLPRVAAVELGGVRFVVTHGTGRPSGYERRLAEAGQEHDADVVVGGHTHEVLDTTRDGMRLLNPGSVTGASPASRTTMMTAEVAGGAIDVTLHEQ